jgi:hypothetical protein
MRYPLRSSRIQDLARRLETFRLIQLDGDRYVLTNLGLEHVDYQSKKRRF